jgi:hypothetical protein
MHQRLVGLAQKVHNHHEQIVRPTQRRIITTLRRFLQAAVGALQRLLPISQRVIDSAQTQIIVRCLPRLLQPLHVVLVG